MATTASTWGSRITDFGDDFGELKTHLYIIVTSTALIYPQALTVTMATRSSTNETVHKHKRGRIKSGQERCLEKHLPFLAKELESEVIVSNLRAKFVLDDNDQENILGCPGNRKSRQDQNRFLIHTLMNRTPRGYEIFLEGLRETGHEHAYHTLKGEGSIRSKRTQDSQTQKFEPELQTTVNGPVIDKTECLDEEFLESNIEDQLYRVADRVGNAETRINNLEHCFGRTKEENDHIQDLQQQLKNTQNELEMLRGVCEQQATELLSKSDEINESQRKLDDQLKAQAELSKQLREKSELLKSAYRKNAEQANKIKELESQVQELKQKLETTEANMTTLRKEVADAEEQRKLDKKQIEEQIKREKKEMSEVIKQYTMEIEKKMEKKMQNIAREEIRRERQVTQKPAGLPATKPANMKSVAQNRPVQHAKK